MRAFTTSWTAFSAALASLDRAAYKAFDCCRHRASMDDTFVEEACMRMGRGGALATLGGYREYWR